MARAPPLGHGTAAVSEAILSRSDRVAVAELEAGQAGDPARSAPD